MKHGNEFYLQLTRTLWAEEYNSLSITAKWLFVTLNELEQRYSSEGKEGYFFRTDEELAADCGFSIRTLKRAKSELKQTDLIKTWNSSFITQAGKRSEKHVTCYQILR